MKPASVAALKELQEKLAFWSTWEETQREWDSKCEKWMFALNNEKGRQMGMMSFLNAVQRPFMKKGDYIGFVDELIRMKMDAIKSSDPPPSETEEQTIKDDIMAMSQEIRTLAETMQRLAMQTVASEAKQFSTTLSEILAEIDGGGETQTQT